MRSIQQQHLDHLSEQARQSPRLRCNLNLHTDDAAQCHRLFNAAEPGTYIRPHRHLDPAKDETMLLIRGQLLIISFDSAGAITGSVLLHEGSTLAVNIPHGTYHTALSLRPGTIFFEAKAGPYRPLNEDERAPWAPAEETAEATAYLSWLQKAGTPP